MLSVPPTYGPSRRVPVRQEEPRLTNLDEAEREMSSMMDTFLRNSAGAGLMVDRRPSGEVDRNRDHYPGDRPHLIYDLGERAMNGTMGVRRVGLRRRMEHFVRGSGPMPLHMDPRSRAFAPASLSLNVLKAFAVDSANKILQDAMERDQPPWMRLLHETRDKEEPERPIGIPLLPIPIDSVREVTNMREEYMERSRHFSVVMHSPSIRSFQMQRAAYVAEIRVTMGPYPEGRAEFDLLVYEDEFEVTVEQQPGPRTQRVSIPPDSNLITRPNRAWKPSSEQEIVAMETLREMVTEKEFRNYLKRGFLVVKGKSGRQYQVFRSKWHAKVWQKGKVVAEICSRINDSTVPATDNVIAFKAMIEADESEFEKAGNVYRLTA